MSNTEDTRQIDVSIIVPIYNVMEYLEPCLESVNKSEGDFSFEVVMVDDGSTDESGEMAQEFQKTHPNFVYYYKDNGGLGSARNYGVKKARGKYIAFLDSDDLVEPDMYYNMFQLAEKNGSELTICNVSRCDSVKTMPSSLHQRLFNNFPYEETTHITKNHNLCYDTISCNKLILKEFFERNHFEFPEERILFEDIPVTLPMHYLTNHVSVVRKVGYLWRVRDGVSKSITQSNSNLKNIKDRLEILRRLFHFYNENVKEKDLIHDLQKKVLLIDLPIYITMCDNVPQKTALIYMRLMNEFMDKYIDKSIIKELPLIYQQKYAYLNRNDYKNLKKTIVYHKRPYSGTRFVFEDGTFKMEVPELFDITTRDIHHEYLVGPERSVDKLTVLDDSFELSTHVFLRKISCEYVKQQDVIFELIGDNGYSSRRLRSHSVDGQYVTNQYGTVYNEERKVLDSYNYDKYAYQIEFNKEDLQGLEDGNYFINIHLKNDILENDSLLSFVDNTTKSVIETKQLLIDNRLVTFHFDPSNSFYLCIQTIQDYATDIVKENGTLMIHTFLGQNVNYNDALNQPIKYFGHEKIHTVENKQYLIYSNRFNDLEIDEIDTGIYIKNISLNDMILKFQLYSMNKLCNAVQLFVQNSISGERIILYQNDKYNSDVDYIQIDFNDSELNDHLYNNIWKPLLEIDGNVVPLITHKQDKEYCENEAIRVVLDNVDNEFVFLTEGKWKIGEETADKRRYLYKVKYNEFKKEEISDHTILFESFWGTGYAGNVRALYEYIDKNHPEYHCIWSFNDERKPIVGRGERIKRNSEQYYYYLAKAKYLVNDVNFPNIFDKRDQQIMIQTMHGTPYKSLGLDVKSDFSRNNDVWMYVRKTMDWDYLISQGKFTDKMVYRWYRYYKTILTTGYPRTDILYESFDKDELKRKLGIPINKKLILYAPTWRKKGVFDIQLDLEEMKNQLSSGYVLGVRIHHLSAQNYNLETLDGFVYDLTNYKSIEELYRIADILITDYSSIMFDYALLKKPMIFYAYDIEEYSENLRGVYFKLDEEAPGAIAHTFDELLGTIRDVDNITLLYQERIHHFMDKYLTYECNNSCEKVFNSVFVEKVKSTKSKILDGTENLINKKMPHRISSTFEKVKIHLMSKNAKVLK